MGLNKDEEPKKSKKYGRANGRKLIPKSMKIFLDQDEELQRRSNEQGYSKDSIIRAFLDEKLDLPKNDSI